MCNWNSVLPNLYFLFLIYLQFLTDTFDALFAILMDNAQRYDKLVFDALVSCVYREYFSL